jgi:hypothetical protein
MDYLIKKSDGTAESLGGTVKQVKLPGQTGGDVVFVGDKRPVDLGDYVLVASVDVTEAVGADTKRGPTTVVVSGETVTVTQTAIAKDSTDYLNDVYAKRKASIANGGYGTPEEQFEILGEQGPGAYQQHIAAVKLAHPKG